MAKGKTISKLSILLGVSSATLKADLAAAAKDVKKFGDKAKDAGKGLQSMDDVRAAAGKGLNSFVGRLKTAAATLAVFAAAAIATQASLGGFSSALERIDKTAKTADKLGTTTEALTAFQFAAELSGVKADAAATALQRLVRRTAEAAKGTGEAKDALKELGLNAAELAAKSPTAAFEDVAEAFKGVETQADKVRLAFKLFDTEGVALVNTLSMGKAGLREVAEEAKRLGFTFDREAAAKVEKANDAMAKMGAAAEGLQNQLAITLAPAIVRMSDSITELLATLQQMDMATIKTVASMAAFGAGFLTTLAIIPRLIAGIRAVIIALRALSAGALIAQGITGVGLAKALAGLAVGVGAAVAVSAAFDKLAEDAGGAAVATRKLTKAADEFGAAELAEKLKPWNEELKKAQAETKKWQDVGDRITNANKSPFEKMREDIAEANEALRRGVISLETYNRAVGKIGDSFLSTAEKSARADSRPRFVGAVRRGTAAGVDAVAKAVSARSQQLERLRELAREAKKRAKLLASVRDAVRDTTDAVRESALVIHEHRIH